MDFSCATGIVWHSALLPIPMSEQEPIRGEEAESVKKPWVYASLELQLSREQAEKLKKALTADSQAHVDMDGVLDVFNDSRPEELGKLNVRQQYSLLGIFAEQRMEICNQLDKFLRRFNASSSSASGMRGPNAKKSLPSIYLDQYKDKIVSWLNAISENDRQAIVEKILAHPGMSEHSLKKAYVNQLLVSAKRGKPYEYFVDILVELFRAELDSQSSAPAEIMSRTNTAVRSAVKRPRRSKK